MTQTIHTHSRESNWKSYCGQNNGYFDILWDLQINDNFETLNKYNMKFRLP